MIVNASSADVVYSDVDVTTSVTKVCMPDTDVNDIERKNRKYCAAFSDTVLFIRHT